VSWTGRICSHYLDPVTTTPPDGPKHPRNEKWRSWNVTKNKAIRINEGDWADYEVVCAADGTDRTKDINEHIRRRIKAYRRKHPNAEMPSDRQADGPDS
jgi:hypothetical protein